MFNKRECCAKKVTEFNCEDEELTIYHKGHHHCIPKINPHEELTIYHEGHHHCIPKINPHEAITIAQDVQHGIK